MGLAALRSVVPLKKGTKTYDFESNEFIWKFIGPPFPYEGPLGEKIMIKHRSRMTFIIGKVIALPLIGLSCSSYASKEHPHGIFKRNQQLILLLQIFGWAISHFPL